MQEHLGAADGVGARDLGVEDLLGGDRGEFADGGVGHREDALDAVDVEVLVPDIVRRRREDRDQATIGQHPVAVRTEHPAALEVESREMPVGLVAVAREEHSVALRERGQRRVFRSVRRDRALRRPFRDGLAPRRTGQDVLGQHHELEVRTDPALRALQRHADAEQRSLHPLRRALTVAVGMYAVAVHLQRERGVAVESLGHVAAAPARVSAMSLQVSMSMMRPWATRKRSHQRTALNGTPSLKVPDSVPRT